MNPLVLLFMAVITFLLGVIALALLPSLVLTLGESTANLIQLGVVAATAMGVVAFLGGFLVSLGTDAPKT